jgi:hypothetical protein
VGPFEKDLTTGKWNFKLSAGFALGLGGEVSFNKEKFDALLKKCDKIVD